MWVIRDCFRVASWSGWSRGGQVRGSDAWHAHGDSYASLPLRFQDLKEVQRSYQQRLQPPVEGSDVAGVAGTLASFSSGLDDDRVRNLQLQHLPPPDKLGVEEGSVIVFGLEPKRDHESIRKAHLIVHPVDTAGPLPPPPPGVCEASTQILVDSKILMTWETERRVIFPCSQLRRTSASAASYS